MPQTKDYVKYGAKIGKRLWVATPYRPIVNDENCITDEEFAPSRKFPNAGLAKGWLRKRLPELGVDWFGRIEAGCYEDCSFSDSGYGHIKDVTWEWDWEKSFTAWQTEAGVEFDE